MGHKKVTLKSYSWKVDTGIINHCYTDSLPHLGLDPLKAVHSSQLSLDQAFFQCYRPIMESLKLEMKKTLDHPVHLPRASEGLFSTEHYLVLCPF